MKANRQLRRPASLRSCRAAFVAAVALAAASCAAPPPPAPPPPAPRPVRVLPPPPPPAPIAPALDWRDRPITPGTWSWSGTGAASVARFGTPGLAALVELRCDRANGRILLLRPGTGADPTAASITTTLGTEPLSARPVGGSVPMLMVAIPARAALLDAIVFSRGRFAVDMQGHAPLYLPTWPEVARVVEDCR